MQKEVYDLTIEPITCVHIGTGETLTPLDYAVVGPTKQGNRVYARYSWDKLLARMEGDNELRAKFMWASDSGSMKELHKFFSANWKPSELEYICQATDEFLAEYDSKKKGDPLENTLEVEEMYRSDGKHRPVIPGSSIKGAVRTAVLNSLLASLDDATCNSYWKKFKEAKAKGQFARFDAELQRLLLGNKNAKTDPFRAVEIEDCEFAPQGSQLVGTVKNIYKNKAGKELNIEFQVIAEVLKGAMLGAGVKGACRLRINSGLQNSKAVTKAISAEGIRESCNYFFKREFKNEYEKFYEDILDGKADYIEDLKQKIEEIAKSENSFVLRVGRWSQVEFVTYEENFREPKTPPGKGFGETRFVFDYDGQYLPLGWCKCTIKKADAKK